MGWNFRYNEGEKLINIDTVVYWLSFHLLELNSPSQKWRAFPEISARLCQPLTVFRSNVPFLNAMARILSSWTRAHRADVHFNKHPHDLFQVPCGVCFQWFVPERSPSYPEVELGKAEAQAFRVLSARSFWPLASKPRTVFASNRFSSYP